MVLTSPPVLSYDAETDVITIDGAKYAASMLRTIGFGPAGKWIRLGERADGKRNCMGFSTDMEAKFCQIAGLKT